MTTDRRTFVALGAAAGLAAMSGMAMAQDFRAAVVLPGSITDQSFNQVVYEGLVKAKERLGIEVAFSEKVKQADQVSAMSDYARRGYDVVIGAGGEFTAAAERVARQNPDAMVVVINGAPTEGIATFNYNNPHFGYVLGYVTGRMSETGNAGIVGGQEFKAFLDLVEGFRKGWAAGGATGEAMVTYTDDWDDVAKAKEATLNLINQGADVVMPYLDNGSVGVIQAAEESGIWVAGLFADLGKSVPETNLASTVLDFSEATAQAIQMAHEGTLERKNYEFDVGSKAGYLGTLHSSVPEEVRAEVEAIIAEMQAGTFEM
ncbi:MAG: BMP family ABC transporter substrate-binding protein [Alphaproteobacteria bacterium HGW-Alphaproteobacteria-2]|nr:MAG: BMP family ABC transporter substrate-binding protein [Alphaproteobacteria bacterium HGW-Alphaproteobacteria-2]